MFLAVQESILWSLGILNSIVRCPCTATTSSTSTNIAADISRPDVFEASCNAFQPGRHVSNSTRNAATFIPAGTNLSFPDTEPSCDRPYQVVAVDLCRITLSVPTSSESSTEIEAWLPRNWTGRFLGTGNGGLGGCVKYEDLEYGSRYGFASIGSNNGHDGNTAAPFYRNPEVVVDFAWRALHTSVIAGKRLVQSFYGRPHTKSYYIGCSSGGRQGIKAAEKFPDDFDGVVVGAPAIDFNNLVSWRAHFLPVTGTPGSPDFISKDMWVNVIHGEILNQCDGIDGVMDGIIEDPSLCKFRPERLRCTSSNETDCLTPTQVEIVRKVFSPLTKEDGAVIYPAIGPGSEVSAYEGFYAGRPFRYSEEWFKNVVYDPWWDPLSFNIQDAAAAEALDPGEVKTWPNNLSKFRERSGKVLIHHGGQDDKISSFNSERFYRHFSRETAMQPRQLDEFLRFFRISGMSHCHSGRGAWMLGQDGHSVDGVPFTRQNNVLAAMLDWVEQGIAPETIESTKFVNDTVDAGTLFRRRHCRYPFRNTYIGGDSDSPESWQCQWVEDWRLLDR